MPESPLLLDTHAWLWLMAGEAQRFKPEVLVRIEAAGKRRSLCVAAISVWEVAMLEAKGRIVLGMPCDTWVEQALSGSGIALIPLSPRIAVDSTRLPGNFHGDPADRMIVSSARVSQATLLTNDGKILGYASLGHVRAEAL
ncbi:MAG: type II toxin-antitoxin system VapC family toxin [Rhodocyclaceae bacterium]|nr:type II toxin-antitoxin system VapC family toxin [Rhodocyclaceae bacterium]